MARDIALIEPDPRDWGELVVYLLDQMEREAEKKGMNISYKELLRLFMHGSVCNLGGGF